MAAIISTNIISPLGLSVEETYKAMRAGNTGLRHYDCWQGLPFPITASLFPEPPFSFEDLVKSSISAALRNITIDLSRTILILSSTKGAVSNLDEGREVTPLGDMARSVSLSLGISNTPLCVCNACISGVAALILGQRLVDSGMYQSAIVCGADLQSRFIVSGFQSLKALSPYECRPFDIERLGLNLGEAAATVVLSSETHVTTNHVEPQSMSASSWHVVSGAVRNDAYHISAPHPKGDGAYHALRSSLITHHSSLACIGTHGTATMYNDQMESMAIERAGLLSVPLSCLKGYLGHTMGAAGVIETILTARALDDGIILPSRNFETRGVSGKVLLSNKPLHTDKRSFVKMLSGFGGANGAILLSKEGREGRECREGREGNKESIKFTVLDSINLSATENGKEMLTELYRQHAINYPKFFKMDILSRLAFLATELLLKPETRNLKPETTALILFNHTSSIVSDQHYEASIQPDEFFPSPSVFVYTLPNISIGEVAIRHGIQGETSFYILPHKDENLMHEVVLSTLLFDPAINTAITGWIDAPSEDHFTCELQLINRQ